MVVDGWRKIYNEQPRASVSMQQIRLKRSGDPYIWVNYVTIASDNGLSPAQRQAVTWTNTDLLSI